VWLSSLTVFHVSDQARSDGHPVSRCGSQLRPLTAACTSCNLVMCLWTYSGLLLTRILASEQKPLPKREQQFQKGVGNVQQRRDCSTKHASMPPVSGIDTVTGVLLLYHQLLKQFLKSKCKKPRLASAPLYLVTLQSSTAASCSPPLPNLN